MIAENLEQLNEDLKQLGPMQRLKMIVELSKFVVPTLQVTELKAKNENNLRDVFLRREIIEKFKTEFNSEYLQ